MQPIMRMGGGGMMRMPGVNRGMEQRPEVPREPRPVITPANPIMSFKKGGKVKKTGLALVHKGEKVVPAKYASTKRLMSRGKKKTSKKRASSKRISTKIKVLRGEGIKQDQSVAMAINMEKKHRLTNSGGYKRVKK